MQGWVGGGLCRRPACEWGGGPNGGRYVKGGVVLMCPTAGGKRVCLCRYPHPPAHHHVSNASHASHLPVRPSPIPLDTLTPETLNPKP